MAEEKKNTNLDEIAYRKALRELLQEYKAKKEIRYDELTDKMATPFHLDADQMDAFCSFWGQDQRSCADVSKRDRSGEPIDS